MPQKYTSRIVLQNSELTAKYQHPLVQIGQKIPEGLDLQMGVRNFADFPFADRTFADGHLLIRHLLTGPGHLLTQTFADFSHPCHLLTLEGRLLIQTFADSDNC